MRPRGPAGVVVRPFNFTVRPPAIVMSARQALWEEVFRLVRDITDSSEKGQTQLTEVGIAALRAIHARQDVLGRPEPFLTEALADYSDDPAEAASLYRRALAESSVHPDEPTHTKRISLAERLIELGELTAARRELMQGRAEAHRLKDDHFVRFADELLAKLAV